MAENSVTHLFYNYQYEVNERAGMWKLKERCVTWCVKDLMTGDPAAWRGDDRQSRDVQSLYPFKNAWLKRLREGMPECVAAQKFVVADR